MDEEPKVSKPYMVGPFPNRIGDYKGSGTYKQRVAITMKPRPDGFIKHNGYVSEHATKEL